MDTGSGPRERLFEQIVAENHSTLASIANTFVGKADAQDLYQEILIQIWISLDGFRNESRLSTWIYRIAVLTACNFRRDGARRARGRARLQMGLKVSTPAISDPASQDGILHCFLRMLNNDDRVTMLLYLGRFSNREIAEVVGVDEAVLRVKISRLRKKFVETFIAS